MAAEQAESFIEPGSTCVAIFPDRGERYLNTIFSDEWVRKNFGEIEGAWMQDMSPAQELALVG
jgi:cysteine synthase A